MKNFPKVLSTKADYLYIKEHFPPELWVPHFQALLDSKNAWRLAHQLKPGDVGKEDATHKVSESKFGCRDVMCVRFQYKFEENPKAKIFRLGFTVSEVESILHGVVSNTSC